ncbi:MAG: polysaccharide biosynthesis protein [Nitrospirae bacterium]|nr:polysaccharide biosynthesis protein [Nitrospirota bacterium]
MTRVYDLLKDFLIRHRRSVVAVMHLSLAALSFYVSFALRFDVFITRQSDRLNYYYFVNYLPLLLIIRLALYLQAGMHKDMWRYASINDLTRIIKATLLGTAIFFVSVRYLFGETSFPRSIFLIDCLLLILLLGGSRLIIRVFREYLKHDADSKRVLIIGAGDAGEMVARDMRNNLKYGMEPIGFIDDDPSKKGLSIHGYPIFGPRKMIPEIIEKYSPDEILIAMPARGHKVVREVFDYCREFDLPVKTLPALDAIVGGKVTVSQIRPLSLEDLLQREQVRTDIKEVSDYISGRCVLVTGAGGSIGSELCRQIYSYKPSKLVMFDRYENGLFQIDLELYRQKKSTFVSSVVGDMTDRKTLENLFTKYKPEIVFHAASHKHVPLMEINPLEAVRNNVFGTRNLIETADGHHVESFVMISTDKAVNPTSVMGATKRVAEFLCMSMNEQSQTRFSTVRFGNVLGSNGSVVTVFSDQIRRGVPLTVTDPEMKRFFMLIPEAAQLVLTAASSGRGGDIFVLEMGEQIRIVELAENVIRFSGFIPYEDIQIEFTGLRPGEKLYEELFDSTEKVAETHNEKIRAAIPEYRPTRDDLNMYLTRLEHVLKTADIDDLHRTLGKIVPNFRSSRSS